MVIGLGKRIPSLLGGVVLVFFVLFEVLWEGRFLIVAFPSKNNRKKIPCSSVSHWLRLLGRVKLYNFGDAGSIGEVVGDLPNQFLRKTSRSWLRLL